VALKKTFLLFFTLFFACIMSLSGCSQEAADDVALSQNVKVELVDWHISGLWVINAPVCWIRVINYNRVPIKDVTIAYQTYDFDGKLLDQGTYTMDGDVGPGSVRNFMEQYVGIVKVESDKIAIQLHSVQPASE
jgi:hypothetical protein